MSVEHDEAAGASAPSARELQLLEAAYGYVLEHGLADMSLRPIAAAIGSSPRVLLYLFGSKDGLIRAILGRARQDELDKLGALRARAPGDRGDDLAVVTHEVWAWLQDREHRALLRLWVEVYARSLVDPAGPWGGFAEQTVHDWLGLLAEHAPDGTTAAELTLLLAVLRGAMFDLLATGDVDRTAAAVDHAIERLLRPGR